MRILLSILFVFTLGAAPLCAVKSNPIEKTDNQQLNIYCLGIEKQYFDLIVEGKKTVEGRVNMPDITNIKSGDMVSFKDEENREILCKVTGVSKYPNFTKMLVSEGVTKMLPSIESDENSTPEMVVKGDKIYQSFPGYRENVKKYGAIAFGLEYTGTIYKKDPQVIKITDD